MSIINADEVQKYLKQTGIPAGKKDLVKAFKAKGDQRVELKIAIRELMDAGLIKKNVHKEYYPADQNEIPAIGVFLVTNMSDDGEILAIPTEDQILQDTLKHPLLIEVRGKKSCGLNDRILVKLKTDSSGSITGHLMRVLEEIKTKTILGRALQTKKGWIIEPVNKSDRHTYKLKETPEELIDGHLVEAILTKQGNTGALTHQMATIKNIIGHDDDPKAISLIAMVEKGLSPDFPDEVLEETSKMTIPVLGNREDLRHIPLVTIDGADARDFDDAVFAEQTDDGGFHIIVAIADVAWYVRDGTALGKEAYYRGNSTYFPDRVVPMLPEKLSNDLCSLRPHEPRACMGFHLYINAKGQLTNHRVFRGLMQSHARLTYEQAQAAFDGTTDEVTEPLMTQTLRPMHDAFIVLEQARKHRGALEINSPERKIDIDETGTMTGVTLRERFDSHKMIEEFMILANVAAAQSLESKNAPCIYRIHDRPDGARIDTASDFLEGFGLNLPKGNIPKPATLNAILKKVEETDYAHLVNEIILRSQSQAVYSPDNIGHYGLALDKYAHFTSPIRRYADLIVHRSLITAYKLGEGGLTKEEDILIGDISDQISKTERNSMEAERSAVDRFTASYLESRMMSEFSGRISGVTKFGLFVRLDENGADGLVPIRSLPDDFYIHHEQTHALIGRRTKRVFRLCAPVRVRIREADRLTGSTILDIVNPEMGADIPGFIAPEAQIMDGRKNGGRNKPFQSQKGRKDNGKKFKKKKTTTPKHKKRIEKRKFK